MNFVFAACLRPRVPLAVCTVLAPAAASATPASVPSAADVQLVSLTLRRIRFNSYPIVDPMSQRRMGVGVFPSGAYFNHSCTPNVLMFADLDMERRWRLLFRSIRPIDEGQVSVCSVTTSRPRLRPRWSHSHDLLDGSTARVSAGLLVCLFACFACVLAKRSCAQEACVAYIDTYQPTPERQRLLRNGFLFDCRCQACVPPVRLRFLLCFFVCN